MHILDKKAVVGNPAEQRSTAIDRKKIVSSEK
jgi:hypothetical protein